MTSKVKKIIKNIATDWVKDNDPLDKEGIDWAFDEALYDEEIDLSRQERKEADKELYALVASLVEEDKIEESVLKEEEIPDSEVIDPTETSLWNKEGQETLEFVVDVDKINKTMDDLNAQFGEDFTLEAIEKGMGVEKEHSSDEDIQFAITLDHLAEDPYYYDKLIAMEQETVEGEDNPEDFEMGIETDEEIDLPEDMDTFSVDDTEESEEDTEEESEEDEDEEEEDEKKSSKDDDEEEKE